MQAMNTDQQTYYQNATVPHPAATGYYLSNGTEPQFSIRSPNPYASAPRMSHPYYNPQMSNNFGQQPVYLQQSYIPNAPFVHTNGPRNQYAVPIIRPQNENANGTQTYLSQPQYHGYPANNILQHQNVYSAPQYSQYQMPHTYAQPASSTQISNQAQSQPQYSATNNQQLPQSSQTSQQSSQDQLHGQSSQSSHSRDKRERKPLAIVDPVSHKTVDIETSAPSVNVSSTITTTTTDETHQKDSVTDSSITNVKSTDDVNKTQIQAEFRQQVARLLDSNSSTDKNSNQTSPEETTKENQKDSVTDSSITNVKSTDDVNKTQIQAEFRQQVDRLLDSNPSTDKNANQTSPEETTKENQIEDVIPQTTSSASSSRSGSISNNSSEKPQPGYPGIRTRSGTDDKSNNEDDIKSERSNSQKETETVSIDLKSSSNDTTNEIDIQNSPTESLENVTPTQSNDIESESTNLEKTPSISKRYDYTIQQLRNKRTDPIAQERPKQLPDIPGITIPPIPKVPVKPKVDGDQQFLREVTAILNKVTPQTFEILLKRLEELELNSAERLEGMIKLIFVKAVEAAIFCSLYADLCKHFEKTQVTVPSESGQPATYFFRQILLTRCQKEFESDYRQEIEYEKRKGEVDDIIDEKVRKEASELLEEDLSKAKRKKLGNIIFIGELFKLRMLTDTIMYDCIEYLLRDKADEEGLECLCKLLRTIGKELDNKAGGEKSTNRKNLEKNYVELNNITLLKQTSARIRFMIQDLMEQRRADWVARRAEIKPTTIDKIHEDEKIKRAKEERDQERDRMQRRDNRTGGGNNPQQYTGSRGSRGSGIRQQSNRTDDDRTDNRVIVNSLRQIQSNDKRNSGQLALNLAPQGAWGKGSGVEKKSEDDRSNFGRTGKPPLGHNQQFRPKTGTPPGTPGYLTQRQPSSELARENSPRDRENAVNSLRQTTSKTGITSPNNTSMTNSREGSRNASRESSVTERTSSTNKISTTTDVNTDQANTSFDEEKTQIRVHALIEEYTENYSDSNDRSVNEAIEDLSSFCTENINHQGVVVRELFTNVLESKPRARKAVGHLLDAALQKNVITTEGFLSGIKMFIEVVPDYAVDIPLIWQYIGEIIGAFIGAPSSNIILLKPILQLIPDAKTKQLFRDIIRYAVEFSSKINVQRFWQSAGFSLNDLFKSDLIDPSFIDEYSWLSEGIEPEPTTPNKENLSPRADPQLVKLFKSINDQGTTVSDEEILSYIRENMNSNDKFYTRNIVLSYLEACLINREPQKKIQEDIAKKRMTVLNAIIEHKPEEEIQAVYAIQNFVNKLEHPKKMAQLLFDIFYDEECVSEEAFTEWLKQPDQSETEGHSIVEISTKDFFTWLQQAETEVEGEEEQEEEKNDTRETWSHNCDYLITTLGGLIGLGSLYRFPYLAFENGGAAFVIPYVLICVLCGIPLLMMETALGQFSRKGPVGCWDFAPAMRGIGIASVFMSFFGALYYVMIMVWGSLYLFHSFGSIGSPLPWSGDVGDISLKNNTTTTIVSSVEHFWNTTILNISNDFDGLSTFHWPSVGGLIVMWTIIYLCLWKGIRLTSRVAIFTALFPYLPMLALFIRGMTLDGAWCGLRYYLIPDLQRLLSKKTWIQAAGHVLWAYGIGWGIIPALSSYNRPDYNFYRDIVVTGSTSIFTNVFSGFIVFPVLGFMSHKANVSIEQVVSSGPGLAFIVYPKAISLMPLPHFWAIIFFFMIFLLGIDSQFVTCESVLTATVDKLDEWYERNPKRRKIRREIVVAVYVLISFSVGLLMTTRAGFYIFNIFDGYICGAIPLLIICIVQLATVLFAYQTTFSSWCEKWPPSQWPGQTFITHISEVLKRRLTHVWLCWIIVVPIWLFGMLAIAIRTIGPISYETFVYPIQFQIIGYALTSLAPLSILTYFIYYHFKENR